MFESATPLSRAQHQAGKIAALWRGAPPIAVVATPADLPVPAPADARGVFVQGKVWVVASTQHPLDVARTLSHEVIAHHGLRKALGPAWRDFMGAVQGGVHAGDMDLQDLRLEVRSAYRGMGLSRTAEADEMAAGVVERGINSRTGRFEPQRPMAKRVAAAMAHFKRESLYAEVPVSYDELEGALLAAEHHVRYGGRFFGLGRRLRGWYAARMPQKWDIHEPPMSLDESERLIAAEKNREGNWVASKLVLSVGGLLICLGMFAYGMLSWVFKW